MAEAADADAVVAQAAPATRVSPTPGLGGRSGLAEGLQDQLGSDLTGAPVSATFNNIPLVAFINEIFGETLGLSFIVAPGLDTQQDLVTLRLAEPIPPSELFATARRVLANYGVAIREEAGVLEFFISEDAAGDDIPLLVSGRSLPEVPATHRTIFQHITLGIASSSDVVSWLDEVFDRGSELRIVDDGGTNSLLLHGPRDLVERALAMIDVFDQPLLQGRNGIIIEPVFLQPDALAGALRSILESEGFSVSQGGTSGAVILLPLDDLGRLVVFAADPASLNRVQTYARMLDEERQDAAQDALFSYPVRHTQAEQLNETLGALLGSGREAGTLVVHKNSNQLLYRGPGKEWAKLRRMLAKLDVPVPSVLIEVLIAEITLDDEQGSGIELVFRGALEGRRYTASTQGALGLSAKGGRITINGAGGTRAVLNFFQEQNRVAIRFRPRALVRSGGTGEINIGNQIPTISAIAESGTQVGGSTNILQQVEYRNTGVRMSVTPEVQANGLVDMDISLTLSEARPTAATSITGSPTILTRELTTSLTLRDGGSWLLGGLISDSRSEGSVGVPLVNRVPLLGRLFRADTYQGDRTELVIMVIPYVIASHEEGLELSERIKSSLELHREAES